MTKPVPDGYHTITMSIVVSPCSEAIDWYTRAFGAEPLGTMSMPDGSVMHSEIKIGDSRMMLSDPMMGAKSPRDLGGTNATVHLYVSDADALWKRAIEAGATPVMEIHDAFWGDRYGVLLDPYGQSWSVATHVEDVSEKEMARRIKAIEEQMAQSAQGGAA